MRQLETELDVSDTYREIKKDVVELRLFSYDKL